MSNSNQEYFYQSTIIKLQYSFDNYCCDAGWHWEAFLNGESLGDSSKDCPETTIDKALFRAKQHIDWMLDIDSNEQLVLIISD